MITNGSTIKVLLIDDHPVVRAGYRHLLEGTRDIQVVAEADNGELGCILQNQYKPDVVIVDLNMPGIGGLETIRRIKMKNPNTKILVFSLHTNETMVTKALQAGACGYLTKLGSPEQLLKAIRQIYNGDIYVDSEISFHTFTNTNTHNPLKSPLDVLSQREFQVFQLISEGNSIAQIAEILSISSKTVGVHHANIMKKLNLSNNTQLLRLAIRCNIIII